MLKTLALDSGRARDIDIILTGMPREKVDKINTMMSIIKRLESAEGSAKIERVYEEAEKEGMDRMQAERYIGELERSGDLFKPRQGIVKSVRHDAD